MGKRKLIEEQQQPEQHEEESKHAEVEQDEEALRAEKKRKKKERKEKKRSAEDESQEETKQQQPEAEEDEQPNEKSEKKKVKKSKSDKMKQEEAQDDGEADEQTHDSSVKAEQSTADDDDHFDLASLKKANKNAPASSTSSSSSQSSAAPAVASTTRIFIGNLPFKITDDLLHATFSPCGAIEGVHWVTDKATGKFYGSAFIDFADASAIQPALQLNHTELLGRPIKVGVATGRQAAGANRFNAKQKNGAHLAAHPISDKPEGTTTVFLGNLSFDVTEDVVTALFKDCGEVRQVRWVEKDGVFKGCGFVEFDNTEATDLAVKLNGREVLGRPMRVDYSGNTNRGDA